MKKHIMFYRLLSFIFTFFIILFVAGCSISSDEKDQEPTKQTEEYSISNYFHEEHGFQLQIPEGRTFQENQYDSIVRFFSPQTGDDSFREDIGISYINLNNNITLDDHITKALSYIKDMTVNYVKTENTQKDLNGIKAQSIIYVGKQGPYDLKWQQVFFIKNNKIYTVTYTALSNTFIEYSTQMNELISSMKFKK